MDRYIELALQMYFKGCTIRQAVRIAIDAQKEDERNGKSNNSGNYR